MGPGTLSRLTHNPVYYAKAKAAVALDPGRHFWLGAAPQLMLVNSDSVRNRWFVHTREIGFRF